MRPNGAPAVFPVAVACALVITDETADAALLVADDTAAPAEDEAEVAADLAEETELLWEEEDAEATLEVELAELEADELVSSELLSSVPRVPPVTAGVSESLVWPAALM